MPPIFCVRKRGSGCIPFLFYFVYYLSDVPPLHKEDTFLSNMLKTIINNVLYHTEVFILYLSLWWILFIFCTLYYIMPTCTGKDSSLFHFFPPSKREIIFLHHKNKCHQHQGLRHQLERHHQILIIFKVFHIIERL